LGKAAQGGRPAGRAAFDSRLSRVYSVFCFGSVVLENDLGTAYIVMRIISKKTLREFWERHADAEEPLLAWYREVVKEDWDTPAKVKEKYRNASMVGDNRVVFNIKGNDYRLVVRINYPGRIVYVRFVGTHAEYDAVDVKEV
jgi:mRNA interferase HigB